MFFLCSAGLLLAVSALQQQAAPGILNLRGVNPYVSAAISDWRKASAKAAALPRQLAPHTERQQGMGRSAGASSFGMSGVNAHVILGPGSASALPDCKATWQRSR